MRHVQRHAAIRYSVGLLAMALLLAAPFNAAKAQFRPPNHYWQAFWNEPCGFLPAAAPAGLDAARSVLRGVEAAEKRRAADFGGIWDRRYSGIEAQLADGADVLPRLLRDIASGLDQAEAKSAYADEWRAMTSVLKVLSDTPQISDPSPSPPNDAPLEMIKHAYFANLRDLARLNAITLFMFRTWIVDGVEILTDPQFARVRAEHEAATIRYYAGARAARLREKLAIGGYLAGASEQRAAVCLVNGVSLLASAAQNLAGGGSDGGGQRALAAAAAAEWRRLIALAWQERNAAESGAPDTWMAYRDAADSVAAAIERVARLPEFPEPTAEIVALSDKLDSMLEARHVLLMRLAG